MKGDRCHRFSRHDAAGGHPECFLEDERGVISTERTRLALERWRAAAAPGARALRIRHGPMLHHGRKQGRHRTSSPTGRKSG